MNTSSCRPARLERFDETVQAMAEGLLIRIGSLEDALASYRSSCSAPFRIPTAETGAAMRAWRAELADLGHWVGSVARGFMEAEAVDIYVSGGGGVDFEDVIIQDDADILDSAHLDGYADPFRGIPDLPGGEGELFGDEDPDGPPKWLTELAESGNAALVMQQLTQSASNWIRTVPPGTTLLGGEILVTSQSAASVGAMSRWLGRASNAATFVVGFGTQWAADAGLPGDERLLRATTSGLGNLGGAAFGAWGGFTVGGACGPAAIVCSPVLGIIGGVAGGILGDQVADLMPWMDDPAPGEHDLDDLTDEIAGGDDPDDATLGMIDLGAIDVALAESSTNPAFNDRVEAIVPERDDVLEAIYGDPGEPPPTGTTTTSTSTTTTTTVPTTQPEGPPTGTVPTSTTSATTTTNPDDLPDGARSPWPDGAPYDVPGDHDD